LAFPPNRSKRINSVLFLAAGSHPKFSPRSLPQENLEACQALNERFAEIEKHRLDLAVYFCEDANNLSVEELLGTIRTFRELFIKALKVREDTSLMLVMFPCYGVQ